MRLNDMSSIGLPVGVAFHQFHSLPGSCPRPRPVQRACRLVRRSEGARTHAHHGSTQHAPRSTQRARCMWRGCWCGGRVVPRGHSRVALCAGARRGSSRFVTVS